MYKCIDLNNILYSVEQYCLLKKDNKHPKHIYCPLCNNTVFIRAENSKEKTHFMHASNTSCLTTDYKILFNSNCSKKTNSQILHLKFSIIKLSYNIFNQIQDTFNINISPQKFINILERLNNKNVFHLLDVTPMIIPYIWINELGRYQNKLFLYTNSYNTETNKLWNLSLNSKKDIILCISTDSNNKIIRTLIPVDKSLLNSTPTYIPISFIKNIIPQIFTALNIDKSSEDHLLRNLLSNV